MMLEMPLSDRRDPPHSKVGFGRWRRPSSLGQGLGAVEAMLSCTLLEMTKLAVAVGDLPAGNRGLPSLSPLTINCRRQKRMSPGGLPTIPLMRTNANTMDVRLHGHTDINKYGVAAVRGANTTGGWDEPREPFPNLE